MDGGVGRGDSRSDAIVEAVIVGGQSMYLPIGAEEADGEQVVLCERSLVGEVKKSSEVGCIRVIQP